MPNPFKQIEPINLERNGTSGWIEESCDLTGDCSSGSAAGFLTLSLSRKKVLFFFSLVFLALFILLFKSFWLQIVGGDKYYALAENNRVKIEYNKAHRGIFFDRNGKPLVQNLFGFSVFVLPQLLPKDAKEQAERLGNLAEITGIPYEEIKSKVEDADKRYFQPILLRTGVPYDRAMLLKIASEEFPGLQLNIDAWRLYPIAESLAHLLGYIGKIDADEYTKLGQGYLLDDNIGKSGLEKQYEGYLKGTHGEKRIEVDALGREKKVISQNDFVAGTNVVLAIDSDLQEKAYQVIKEQTPNGRGSIVISDCRNGQIMAMVDYPSFDNNLFTGGIIYSEYKKLLEDERKPMFTRSIFGEYPSGSTIKPVMSAAALQEKIVTKNTTVNSTGGINIGQWRFPDWKAGGHGVTNVTKAIAWSVNTFFYYIGGGYGDFKGLGLEKIIDYYKLFGLGEITGIDLPGERKGFLPSESWKKEVKKEPWYIGDTYHLSIGQGDLLVTPLQVNNYIVAIANGGTLYQPSLAIGAVYPNGDREAFPTKIIRNVAVDKDNLATIRQGMRETVTYGSGRSLDSLPVEVAGKTGTAQWSSNKKNHAWFTGFAPYNNPNFCITVLVEEGGEGSAVAVPVAKEIMAWWFTQPNSVKK